MIFKRDLAKALKRFAKFPVVGVFGPRQSGKTTLVKETFKKHVFLNLENPQTRAFAEEDPEGFLNTYENEHGIILDEFQHVPQILSYIQIASDEKKRPGYFVLTGSQNFLMNQAITQSLAGRIGILTLLPLSINELKKNKQLPEDVNELIVNGGYPRVYAEKFASYELYPSYIQSYLERDVRQLTNVENLKTFQKFMQLCAGRVGQLLNVADLATNCGIHRSTVESWLSILEASYILFLLKPYSENFKKRIVKAPKLYFYDTGVVCSLLDIKAAQELSISSFRGPLFENLIIADFAKQYFNKGLRPPLYFWRDKNGSIEVDCVIHSGGSPVPIEIKSSKTPMSVYFQGLLKWNELAELDPAKSYVIYGGSLVQKRSVGNLLGWEAADDLVTRIEKALKKPKKIRRKTKK